MPNYEAKPWWMRDDLGIKEKSEAVIDAALAGEEPADYETTIDEIQQKTVRLLAEMRRKKVEERARIYELQRIHEIRIAQQEEEAQRALEEEGEDDDSEGEESDLAEDSQESEDEDEEEEESSGESSEEEESGPLPDLGSYDDDDWKDFDDSEESDFDESSFSVEDFMQGLVTSFNEDISSAVHDELNQISVMQERQSDLDDLLLRESLGGSPQLDEEIDQAYEDLLAAKASIESDEAAIAAAQSDLMDKVFESDADFIGECAIDNLLFASDQDELTEGCVDVAQALDIIPDEDASADDAATQ